MALFCPVRCLQKLQFLRMNQGSFRDACIEPLSCAVRANVFKKELAEGLPNGDVRQ